MTNSRSTNGRELIYWSKHLGFKSWLIKKMEVKKNAFVQLGFSSFLDSNGVTTDKKSSTILIYLIKDTNIYAEWLALIENGNRDKNELKSSERALEN